MLPPAFGFNSVTVVNAAVALAGCVVTAAVVGSAETLGIGFEVVEFRVPRVPVFTVVWFSNARLYWFAHLVNGLQLSGDPVPSEFRVACTLGPDLCASFALEGSVLAERTLLAGDALLNASESGLSSVVLWDA